MLSHSQVISVYSPCVCVRMLSHSQVISVYSPCVCAHAQSLRCVRLFVAPWTVVLQDPLSKEFLGKNIEWVAVSSSRN